MLHAYLLVDGARTTQFNTRQDSEFCQLKRYFYQYVKSFRSQGNPVSWWSETTVGIINVYSRIVKVNSFYHSSGVVSCDRNKNKVTFIHAINTAIGHMAVH